MLLRPQKTNPETYKIIGETLIHGLYDAIALLGNVPAPWRTQVRSDSTGLFTKVSFLNGATNEVTTEDPRLPPLTDGWVCIERERTVEDPRIFRAFKNEITGKEQNWDPRMTQESLTARGVKLTEFNLI